MQCWTPLAAAALLASACTSDPGEKCDVSSDCSQGAYCHERLKVCIEIADAGSWDAGSEDAGSEDAGSWDANPGDAGKECTPVATTEQNCGDGVDDDCNGKVDCADPACGGRVCQDDHNPCTVDKCIVGKCAHDYPVHPPAEWSNWPAPPEDRADKDFVLVGGAAGAVAVDTRTCLMWRRSEETDSLSWVNARAACSGAVGGYNDWRLPTRIELLSLVNLKKLTAPTINSTAFFQSSAAHFWTATSDSSDSGKAWYVCFAEGDGDTDLVSQAKRVRCVR